VCGQRHARPVYPRERDPVPITHYSVPITHYPVPILPEGLLPYESKFNFFEVTKIEKSDF
jgi:hypothetical protein